MYNFSGKWHIQTVQTQLRLFVKEQSDLGLYCLQFHQEICVTNAQNSKFRHKSIENSFQKIRTFTVQNMKVPTAYQIQT